MLAYDRENTKIIHTQKLYEGLFSKRFYKQKYIKIGAK